MELEQQFTPGALAPATRSRTGSWVVSLPLACAVYVFLHFMLRGQDLLLDGDTYSHIAAGRWILEHGVVPTQDPFSHTMHGAPWTAFEWLSQVVLALIHGWWGWAGLVAATSLCMATTIALLTRALLRHFEPIYVILFAGLAVSMTAGHVLARPHMLVMPLTMLWMVELVRAADEGRAPAVWLAPLMAIWANLHGSFTLGIAFALVFAAEALISAWGSDRFARLARAWGTFIGLALLVSLLTPHGFRGLMVTWQVLFQDQYALSRIGEWRSPNFHTPQPLELWLLGAFAVALHQGLKLPPVRLLLVLGLVHLSLKHIRYVELLGLLGPLVIAAPLSAQWRARQQGRTQFQVLDRFFARLSRPAGLGAMAGCAAIMASVSLWIAQTRPIFPPASIAPVAAIDAAQKAGVKGPVLNGYEWGGYLTYLGTPVFIDGRSDMYRDAFIREYVTALELHDRDALDILLDKYKVTWTLLPKEVSANALLDHLPNWRRVYADDVAVVHARVNP